MRRLLKLGLFGVLLGAWSCGADRQGSVDGGAPTIVGDSAEHAVMENGTDALLGAPVDADPSGGHGGGGGQTCGDPAVEGPLSGGQPVCLSPHRKIPVKVTGDFGKAIQLAVGGPNGYEARGKVKRTGRSCNYAFKWSMVNATDGDYTFDVTGANGTRFSFKATLTSDPAICGGGEGGTTGGTPQDPNAGGGEGGTTGGAPQDPNAGGGEGGTTGGAPQDPNAGSGEGGTTGETPQDPNAGSDGGNGEL
jgi:hypothetical protein